MIKRVSELIELNDGVSKLVPFDPSVKVIISNTRRIIDFSRFFGGTSSCHESDCINWISLKEP